MKHLHDLSFQVLQMDIIFPLADYHLQEMVALEKPAICQNLIQKAAVWNEQKKGIASTIKSTFSINISTSSE